MINTIKFSEIGKTKKGIEYIGFYINEAYHAVFANRSIIPTMWFFEYKGKKYSFDEKTKKILQCAY